MATNFAGRQVTPRWILAALVAAVVLTVAPPALADVPVCSLPDNSFAEGDGGIFVPAFKADCTAPVPADLLFHLRTADGTAVAPADYQALDTDAGPNGQELEVVVVIVGDTLVEPDETFTLTVSDPSGRVTFSKPTATITIVDDDKPHCSIEDASFSEGDGGDTIFQFQTACDRPLTQDLSFHIKTADGTAVHDLDYYGIDGDGSVSAGQQLINHGVRIIGDTRDEPDETFTYTISDPAGTVVFAKDTATITILDDDEPSSGPCILLSDTSVSVSGIASTPATRQFASPDHRLTVTNCGDADTHIAVRGTNATGAGATWQLTNASSGGPIDSTCDLGPNIFRVDVTLWLPGGGGIGTPLTTQDTPLLAADGSTPFLLPDSATQEFSPDVELPCRGSDNLGDLMTMTIDLTAVTP